MILEWLTDNIGIITALVGLITIFAIFRSPQVALRLQKKIEQEDNHKERKLNVFKTLMATRAEPVSFEHVKALNMIDVEFYHDQEITSVWNVYRDHLNSYPQNPTEAEQTIWNDKTSEKLAKLLFEMSKCLGYKFDEILLKKGAYTPMAHGFLNVQQAMIRSGCVDILTGRKSLKVEVVTEADNS